MPSRPTMATEPSAPRLRLLGSEKEGGRRSPGGSEPEAPRPHAALPRRSGCAPTRGVSRLDAEHSATGGLRGPYRHGTTTGAASSPDPRRVSLLLEKVRTDRENGPVPPLPRAHCRGRGLQTQASGLGILFPRSGSLTCTEPASPSVKRDTTIHLRVAEGETASAKLSEQHWKRGGCPTKIRFVT